ncbi:membrane-associated protein, putative, partial [Bodo saltans]
AVDLGMGVLCGAIAGGAQVDSDPCSAVILSGWLLAAISFLFVPAVLYFRPYACRQDAGLGIVSAAITVISSVGAATNAIDNTSNFALSLLCIALQLLPLINCDHSQGHRATWRASELMVSRWWKRSLLPGEAPDAAALEKNSRRNVTNLDVLLELSKSASRRSAHSDPKKVLFSLVRLICERQRRKEKVLQS